FLANMSHELRTPLNSIILLSDTLSHNRNQNLQAEDIKKADIINSSGNELLRLINDVLDLSKVEAGKMELIVDNFNSENFCEDMDVQFEPQAANRNLTFNTIDNYGGIVVNDRDRLSQVIRNLISNSLKFTENGGITLQIDKVEDNEVKVSVIDTGVGVAPNKLKSIFEAFQQADGSTSRQYGGTGLGLSISRELVKLMKGELSVESKEGEGSIFSITIPNLNNGEKEIVKTNVSKPKTKVAKKTKSISGIKDDRDTITAIDKPFLIIEDDENFAEILRDKVKERNEFVLVATTGKEGLEIAKNYTLKGVMLDLGLPDMDGIDLLKEFKTNLSLRKIPVYVISGTQKEKLAKGEGAIGY
ncbi:MAG: response regulator, partial [Arcobacteraceae bacterium]|nr:response regulator [Arcobacteraceae bacterium]